MVQDIHEIQLLSTKIQSDVKYINELSTLQRIVKSKSEKALVKAALQSLYSIFDDLAKKGDLVTKSKIAGKEESVVKYQEWLWKQYTRYLNDLYVCLVHYDGDANMQVYLLRLIMKGVQMECVLKGDTTKFGTNTYFRLLKQILFGAELHEEVLDVLIGEFVNPYGDVVYNTLMMVSKIAKLPKMIEHQKPMERKNVGIRIVEDISEMKLADHCITLLKKIRLPVKGGELKYWIETLNMEEDATEDESSDDEDSDDESQQQGNLKLSLRKKVNTFVMYRNVFGNCWMAVLQLTLSKSTVLEVLHLLPKTILPNMPQPLRLADFLTNTYAHGGVIGLLALNSLYILISKFNFDYPDFYGKLYNLLSDDSILWTKHREQFFQLIELFLSSSHLPAYIVAAFAKRLSRVALRSDPGTILFIIPFVYNLLLRHKECMQLIHRTGSHSVAEQAANRRSLLNDTNDMETIARKANSTETYTQGSDPFNNTLPLSTACNALQSSLWELYSLKQHYDATVSNAAKCFEEKLRNNAFDLSQSRSISYNSLFENAIKRRINQPLSLRAVKQTKLFPTEDTSLISKVFQL